MLVQAAVLAVAAAAAWVAYLHRSLLRREAEVLVQVSQTLQGFVGKRVLITGANSGVGFAAAKELAKANVPITLACRNPTKAEAARNTIVAATPKADVDVLIVDVSSPPSVVKAIELLQSKGTRYHAVFCNAGIFPATGFSWGEVLTAFFCRCTPRNFFETGRCIGSQRHCIQQPCDVTVNGTELLFTTHVLGHYILLQGMLEHSLLGPQGRVVWTGSRSGSALPMVWRGLAKPSLLSTALAKDLAAADKATEYTGIAPIVDPYGASKYATDLLSKGLDGQLQKQIKGHSVVICPGFVDTHVAPAFFRAFTPILNYFRAFLPSFQITPERGGLTLVQGLLLHDEHCDGTKKWVRDHGELVPARNGVFPLVEAQVDLVMRVCKELRQQLAGSP